MASGAGIGVAVDCTSGYLALVGVRATVQNGRLIVDEPTQLPDGTVLDLVIDDEGDDLDEEQRRALAIAIDISLEEAAKGQMAPASDVLAQLRARRRV